MSQQQDTSAGKQPEGTPPASTALHVRHAKLIIFATVFGVMMDAVDVTALAVANPVIAVDLHTVLSALQWVTVAYVVTQAALLIIAGKLSDVLGHKRVFLVGLIGFALASACVGLSGSVTMMIASRVAQGVFGCVLFPSSLAILRVVFPPEELKKAVAIWGGALAFAGAAGPVLSGLIVNYLGWRWVFFLNLVIAAIAVAVGGRLIPDIKPQRDDRGNDLPGVVLLAITLASLVWGIIQLPNGGFHNVAVPIAFAITVVALVLFLFREQRTDAPLLPLSLFRARPLSASTIVLVFATFTMTGTLFFISLYLQQVLGLRPLQAGLVLVPTLALFSVGAPVGASLNQRFGPKVPIVLGLLVIAGSLYGLSRLQPGSSVHAVWPYLATLGLGIGAVNPTATVVVLGSAPMKFAGVASGLQQTAGMIGSSLGTSTIGMALAFGVSSALPNRLSAAGVPAGISHEVLGRSAQISQGVVALPRDVSGSVGQAVIQAGHQAFTDGLGLGLLVAALVAVATAVFAAVMVPGASKESPDANENGADAAQAAPQPDSVDAER